MTNRTFDRNRTEPYPPINDGVDIWTKPEPYVATEELAFAVNMALHLRRPLLLEGDPGCGKTKLARAVAYQLGYPLKECYIRSTSQAQDLLYAYDAVSRLYDIQERVALAADSGGKPVERLRYREDYVKLGALGEAIELASQGIPSVVLIDEIDKADLDFPNDLLQVLDEFRFEIDELINRPKGLPRPDTHTIQPRYDALTPTQDGKGKAHLPLVLITSNREKELPKPFLRRCLFHYVEFPSEAVLADIIRRHKGGDPLTSLLSNGIKLFLALRDESSINWRKKPSTSELLDFLQVLERDEQENTIPTNDLISEELIPKMLADLPERYLGALVKNQSDRAELKRFKTSHA